MDGQGIHFRQDLPDGIVDFRRSGNGGVAQTVIEDILPAHFRSPAVAVFKQLPDHTSVGAKTVCIFVDHGDSSFF